MLNADCQTTSKKRVSIASQQYPVGYLNQALTFPSGAQLHTFKQNTWKKLTQSTCYFNSDSTQFLIQISQLF
ncbi:hypothetical protein SUGI_0201360 [Cryptomeria japonica]|nr:hypothetical protein SUGI_0201360 [Cryptomeria japonica]